MATTLEGGESRGSLDALKEWTKPTSPTDWSRLVLALVFAGLTLLAGRIWGESVYAATNARAIQNEARVTGLERRFEDHVQVESELHSEVLTQLREIRRLLSGARPEG